MTPRTRKRARRSQPYPHPPPKKRPIAPRSITCLGKVCGVLHVLRSGALRKGPPFHGSRSSREIRLQSASCQMGGREVAGRLNSFFLHKHEWLRSYNVTISITVFHGLYDPWISAPLFLKNSRTLLCFPRPGASLESVENEFKKTSFQKPPFPIPIV